MTADALPAIALVLIRGLPGSGKSTLAQAFVASGAFDHYEADQFFTGPNGYRFDRAKLADAHALCQSRAAASLRKGRGVVVANTFTRRWEMEPYAEIAKRAGVPFVVLTATGEFPNIHGVPEAAIAQMRERWEPTPAEWAPEPPTSAQVPVSPEGWADEWPDVLDYVRATTEHLEQDSNG